MGKVKPIRQHSSHCYNQPMTPCQKADEKALNDKPEGLPEPLPEPNATDRRLEAILAALADPLRLSIVRKLLLEAQTYAPLPVAVSA